MRCGEAFKKKPQNFSSQAMFLLVVLMKSPKEKMFIPCFLLDVSTLGQHVLIIKVTNSPWGLDSSRPAMKMQSVSSLFQTMMM